MKIILAYLLTALISYLLGSINAGIIIAKLVAKKDIRTEGSGNAGATNVLRVLGVKPAIFTLIIDCLKSTLSVFLAMCLFKWLVPDLNNIYGLSTAAFFSVIGHMFPVYFNFKGGKGVMTLCGALVFIHPIYVAVSLAVFVLVILITKYVSLGSIVACIFYLLLVAFIPLINGTSKMDFWFEVIVTALTVFMVIFKHRANIKRLCEKTESKISFKNKKKA